MFIKDAVSLVHKNASGRFKIECQPKVLAECELQFMYWLVTSTAGLFLNSEILISPCLLMCFIKICRQLNDFSFFFFSFLGKETKLFFGHGVYAHINIIYTHAHIQDGEELVL